MADETVRFPEDQGNHSRQNAVEFASSLLFLKIKVELVLPPRGHRLRFLAWGSSRSRKKGDRIPSLALPACMGWIPSLALRACIDPIEAPGVSRGIEKVPGTEFLLNRLGDWRIRQLCPSDRCYSIGIRATAQRRH